MLQIVANNWKYSLVNFTFVLRTENPITFASGSDALRFPVCNYIQISQTSQGYIFRYLLHFATKLWNFTNLKVLFLAAAKDFVHIAIG